MITGTLGKALGGAAGGYVAASAGGLRHARPALAAAAVLERAAADGGVQRAARRCACCAREPELVERLHANTALLPAAARARSASTPLDGEAAIIPIIVGETAFAIQISHALLDEGVFVTGFGFPVVPEGTARIRVQMSAALTRSTSTGRSRRSSPSAGQKAS